jgi:hypothetical protein
MVAAKTLAPRMKHGIAKPHRMLDQKRRCHERCNQPESVTDAVGDFFLTRLLAPGCCKRQLHGIRSNIQGLQPGRTTILHERQTLGNEQARPGKPLSPPFQVGAFARRTVGFRYKLILVSQGVKWTSTAMAS